MIKLLCFALVVSCISAEEVKERIFTNLYATRAWGTDEEGLGSSGSTLDNSRPYIQFLQSFLSANNIKSVVDAGCGDWSFSKAIDWGNISYVGIDIVGPVIERNRQRFSASNISFLHGDINEMELPAADLLICKDVLHYLSNGEVEQFLKRISKYKFCLFTNDVLGSTNRSIVCGDHRPLDLSKPPFNLSGANLLSYSSKHVLLKINQEEVPSPVKKSFAINKVHPYQGFFSVFLTVINYLDLYDKQEICGLTVDFKNHGLYYDTAHGPNSWNYYFEPLTLGSSEGAEIEYSESRETGRISYLAEIGLSKERISELIKKYIRVKQDILKETEDFAAEKFQGKYVVGIHYRGTDKSKNEANSVSYESIQAAITDYIKGIDDYVIFVATDEEPFISYMEKNFAGKIVYQSCLRSSNNNPVHYFNPKNNSPYKLGKEAVIDCLLLSKCNHLIRTSSCLSLVSEYFNPQLTDTLLNKRVTHCYSRF